MAQTEVQPLVLIQTLAFASISILSRPGGGSALEGVLVNLGHLSPVLCGLSTIKIIFRIISWRILNIASLRVCLWLTVARQPVHGAGSHWMFEGHTRRTLGYRRVHAFGRWAFFLAGTVPNYIRLMTFRGVPWTQLCVSCMVASFLMTEVLYFSWTTFPKDAQTKNNIWPKQTLLELDDSGNSHNTQTLQQATSNMQTAGQHENSGLNRSPSACGRLSHSPSSADETPSSSDIENPLLTATEVFEILENPQKGWGCRHFKCLFGKNLHVLAYSSYSTNAALLLEFLLPAWLIHTNLRPLLLPAVVKTTKTGLWHLLEKAFSLKNVTAFLALVAFLYGFQLVSILWDWLMGQSDTELQRPITKRKIIAPSAVILLCIFLIRNEDALLFFVSVSWITSVEECVLIPSILVTAYLFFQKSATSVQPEQLKRDFDEAEQSEETHLDDKTIPGQYSNSKRNYNDTNKEGLYWNVGNSVLLIPTAILWYIYRFNPTGTFQTTWAGILQPSSTR